MGSHLATFADVVVVAVSAADELYGKTQGVAVFGQESILEVVLGGGADGTDAG